ncbi:hypothetical protein YC2023_106067 [Brassica napus]
MYSEEKGSQLFSCYGQVWFNPAWFDIPVFALLCLTAPPVQLDHVLSRPPPSSFSAPPSRSATGNEEINDLSRHHHQLVTPSPSVITSPFYTCTSSNFVSTENRRTRRDETRAAARRD